MDNYQSNSYIEQNFIKQCSEISKYINPNIFLSRYNKFSKEFISLYEDDLVNTYKNLHQKFPNTEFALKGRIKSKFSFCKKTIEKLNDFFNLDQEPNPKEKKKHESQLENLLKQFDNNGELLCILKSKDVSSNTKLNMIYSKLTPEKQNELSFFLGLCDDIYAHRLIVRSVGTKIAKSEYTHGKLYISDINGNKILVEPAIKITDKNLINQIQDTLDLKPINDVKVLMSIHGKKEEINLNNIEKNNDKSLKYNDDGSLTLLRDAIQLKDLSTINVTNSNIINIDNNTYIKNDDSELIKINDLILKKYDEPSVTRGVYQAMQYLNDCTISQANTIQDIVIPQERSKDYIKNPKESGYQSIHKTFLRRFYNKKDNRLRTLYSEEIQARTLQMEIDTKNPNSKLSHNNYKSSKDDLSELITNPDIELSDLFPSYILVTNFPSKNNTDNITSWKPSLKYSFDHVFPDKDYETVVSSRAAEDNIFDSFDYDGIDL